jgi:hypothetical protein
MESLIHDGVEQHVVCLVVAQYERQCRQAVAVH